MGPMKMLIDANTLNQVAFLRSLDPTALDILKTQCNKVHFPAGEIILREGDTADAAYILLNGSVQIYKEKSNGEHLF